MATKKLTEYERRRLENIKRNVEMIESLKLQNKAYELSASAKRHRVQAKTYKSSPDKKAKSEEPPVLRRSLRARGIPPINSESKDLDTDIDSMPIISKPSSPKNPTLVPLLMKDAYRGSESNRPLIQQIEIDHSFNTTKAIPLTEDGDSSDQTADLDAKSIDVRSLTLEPENIARIIPGRILSMRFFPSPNMKMVVAGNKFGNVSFWNMDYQNEQGDGIYLYHPHAAPVSAILVQPWCLTKIFTSCYDGFLRLMDVEKEVFDLIYSSEHSIYSMSDSPKDANTILFAEGKGGVTSWDERAGKVSNSWVLHDNRINTIDFNACNHDMMATCSTDGTACIWDVRQMNAHKPKPLKTIRHKRAVHSAYFSPSGALLATTSIDNNVGLLSGDDYGDFSLIYHENRTGRWLSSFRAIWGWDDEHVFIGNMGRGLDVISSTRKRVVMTHTSPLMSTIPCRIAAHPYHAGMLAGATASGLVYVWTF